MTRTLRPVLQTIILSPQQATKLRYLNRAEAGARTDLRVAAMRLEAALMEAQQATVDYLVELSALHDFDPDREWSLDNGALVTRMTEAEALAAADDAADTP